MGAAGATGGAKLQALAARLRAAGSEGKGLRRRVRAAIVVAVQPMKSAVQDDIRAIPSKGHDGPSLRDAMVKQTKVRIRASGATALVRLEVAGPGTLPAYMEGLKSRWLHPVWDSSRHRWTKTPQAPHPYFRRAVIPHLVDVRAGVEAAVAETAASIRI